jgi:L-ascorbate metabolism protein UlaG (beta-lactamase superfamily)
LKEFALEGIMEVRWRGDLCFELKESTGTTVLLDPHVLDGSDEMTADIVTVSNREATHSIKQACGSDTVVIEELDVLEHKGVTVNGTKSTDDGETENIIFKVHMDGIDVCHLGKISEECDVDLVSDLLPVDVLIVPIGGEDTIDAEGAMKYVDALMPDFVIPMHYKTEEHPELDKLSAFLRFFDDEDIIECEEASYKLSRDEMTNESTKVIVLSK